MGCTHKARDEEKRLATLLCRLPDSGNCNEAWPLQNAMHVRTYRLARRRQILRYGTCKQWLHASRDWKRISVQESLYIILCTLLLCASSFWATNALRTFQRAMYNALSGVTWQFALVYVDNIIVCTRSAVQHIDYVEKEVAVFTHAGVSLKVQKYNLFTETVDYLDHVIHPGCLAIAHATDTIKSLRASRNVTELKSIILCFSLMITVRKKSQKNGILGCR